MSNYSDGKYQVVDRHWIGLPKAYGGDSSAGFTFGTTDATTQKHVKRYYPKGPVKVVKVGAQILATLHNASVDIVNVRFVGRGGSASAIGNFNIQGLNSTEATTSDAFLIASDIALTASVLKAGEYISINTATPTTDKATEQITATLAGTVAYFIDTIRHIDAAGDKWNPQA